MAAAVSGAGGLGMIGVGSAGSVALVEREVASTRRAGLGFGIGLLDWKRRREPALLDAAIAAAPTLLSISFGDDWSSGRARQGCGDHHRHSGLRRRWRHPGRTGRGRSPGGQRRGGWRPR